LIDVVEHDVMASVTAYGHSPFTTVLIEPIASRSMHGICTRQAPWSLALAPAFFQQRLT
jgi:hypothetical protein